MATIGRQGLTWYSMGKLFVSIRKYKMAAIARHCLTRYSVNVPSLYFCIQMITITNTLFNNFKGGINCVFFTYID